MRTLEEICEEIVVQMAALVTEEGIPTCIQGKTLSVSFPGTGRMDSFGRTVKGLSSFVSAIAATTAAMTIKVALVRNSPIK